MYTQLWNKYLPIIKILLKRSHNGDQSLSMDTTDFERAGINAKSGKKFTLNFVNGRPTTIVSTSPLSKELTDMLLQDATIKEMFLRNEYTITMNTKFVLSIVCNTKEPQEKEAVAEENNAS